MAGLPELQVQVAALQAKTTALQESLVGLSSRLNEVAANASRSASVPALTDLVVQAVTEVNQVVDVISAFSSGAVSRTYLDSLLP